MLFRIEDVSGFSSASLRSEYDSCYIKKGEVDEKIATFIRDEVNGSKDRRILSYSKSLAACLLKYNKFTDNELHICFDNINFIQYASPKGYHKIKDYVIQDRLANIKLFNPQKLNDVIELTHFVVDVSNNEILDNYLRHFTGVGKKKYASPEKDCEVAVLNPQQDLTIKHYIDAVYILYGLQLKYNFLCDKDICEKIIYEIQNIDPFRFYYNPEERNAFIYLIEYLANEIEHERSISKGIYEFLKNSDHFPHYYDSILQFEDINGSSFRDSYINSDYNTNILSELFWKNCALFLGYDL